MAMNATYPQAIMNIDVIALVNRMDRMYIDMCKSQSANMPNGLLEADASRFVDYLDDYERELNYVTSKPIPDMPEASGMLQWTVPLWDDMYTDPDNVENDDIAQLLMQIIAYRVEATHSQSNRLVQGFIPVKEGPSDVVRLQQGLARLRNLVTFVATTNPSDRPESTPREMPVTSGRLGTGTASK